VRPASSARRRRFVGSFGPQRAAHHAAADPGRLARSTIRRGRPRRTGPRPARGVRHASRRAPIFDRCFERSGAPLGGRRGGRSAAGPACPSKARGRASRARARAAAAGAWKAGAGRPGGGDRRAARRAGRPPSWRRSHAGLPNVQRRPARRAAADHGADRPPLAPAREPRRRPVRRRGAWTCGARCARISRRGRDHRAAYGSAAAQGAVWSCSATSPARWTSIAIPLQFPVRAPARVLPVGDLHVLGRLTHVSDVLRARSYREVSAACRSVRTWSGGTKMASRCGVQPYWSTWSIAARS